MAIRPGSAVVASYEPPLPAVAYRVGCPHHQPNLASFFDATLWPNSTLPAPFADITLPVGVRMLLARDPSGPLGLVTVPAGSELIFGENSTHGVTVSATGIIVHGALRAGSSSCRLATRVTITLRGTRPATRAALDALPEHAKGIHATGTLELHGQLYHRTWTRLARPVQPGDTTVWLQAPVNWVGGQQIVLTTTALKDARDWHRNEVVTLAGQLTPPPHSFGAALQLASPAQYAHHANDAWQGEVGLLSRTVVVEGDVADSEPTDTTPLACADDNWWTLGSHSRPCANHLTGFGAHVTNRRPRPASTRSSRTRARSRRC